MWGVSTLVKTPAPLKLWTRATGGGITCHLGICAMMGQREHRPTNQWLRVAHYKFHKPPFCGVSRLSMARTCARYFCSCSTNSVLFSNPANRLINDLRCHRLGALDPHTAIAPPRAVPSKGALQPGLLNELGPDLTRAAAIVAGDDVDLGEGAASRPVFAKVLCRGPRQRVRPQIGARLGPSSRWWA